MSKDRHRRLHELFTVAVELPADHRDDWLQAKCGGDHALLTELRALLAEDERSQDPLEAGVRQVLRQRGNGSDETLSRSSVLGDFDIAKRCDELPDSDVSSDEFCDQLSEIDVLSGDELVKWLESIQPPETREDPQVLARQLVAEGRLTEFQASVLLGGKSKKLLIDKYLILDLLDSGGMGMVFKAVHRTMKRVVALKMLPPGRFSSPAAVQRFRREVEVAATLEHPNIVTAHDADESKGVHFLVMEYARGRDLYKKVTADGPLSVAQAVRCVLQTAAGLQHAHEKGITHRDIKPGNLILADTKTIKILDLGLASIGERTEPEAGEESDRAGDQLTRSGTLLGTVAYMAPEQAVDSANVDARCDIYSLGCTFYFLLTGETPYGSDPVNSIDRHQNAEIPSLRGKRPDVPDAIDAVYQKMLAKDPDKRQQSMAEVIAALEACKLPEWDRNETRSGGPQKVGANTSGMGRPSIRDAVQQRRTDQKTGRDRQGRGSSGMKRAAGALVGVTLIGLLSLIVLTYPTSEPTPPPSARGDTATSPASDDPPPLAIAPFDAERARHYQETWAKHLGVPVEFTNSIGMKFVLIPPGRFSMGATGAEAKEFNKLEAVFAEEVTSDRNNRRFGYTHEIASAQQIVEIENAYYIGVNEVTFVDYSRFVARTNYVSAGEKAAGASEVRSELDAGYRLSDFRAWVFGGEQDLYPTNESPMIRVTREDAVAFSEWLCDLDNRSYTLPDEQQWEHACRVGRSGSLGDVGGMGSLDDHVWYLDNSDFHSHAVGTTIQNGFGVHDMLGNVAEICIDGVERGGSYSSQAHQLHPAARRVFLDSVKESRDDSGFRLICEVDSVLALAANQIDATANSHSTGQATPSTPDDPPPLAIAPFDAEQARQHQEAWARYLGVPVEYTDSLGIKFSLIPPGRFGMGCKQSESEVQALFEEKLWVFHREQPWHQVEISKPFYLATFEITQSQWATVMKHWPEEAGEREATHNSRPMTYVSWVDSEDLCKQLTLTGEGVYRLPTEAEWEFACRAGTETPFYFGEDAAQGKAYAWFRENSIDVGTDDTSDVGSKTPNAWGLYDMIGNVWEWCHDWMDDAYYQHSPPVDPMGPDIGQQKVLRGGSWRDGPQCLRTTVRLQSQLRHRSDNRGLRVVLSVESVRDSAAK